MDMATLTTRQLAGTIVRDEVARLRLTHEEAAAQAGIARSTLTRVFEGDLSVRLPTFGRLEGALDLPTRFLGYVIADDRDRIARLAGLRDDLRQLALDELAIIAS